MSSLAMELAVYAENFFFPICRTGDAGHFKLGIQVDHGTYCTMNDELSQMGFVRITCPFFIFWDPLSKFCLGEAKHFNFLTEIYI